MLVAISYGFLLFNFIMRLLYLAYIVDVFCRAMFYDPRLDIYRTFEVEATNLLPL